MTRLPGLLCSVGFLAATLLPSLADAAPPAKGEMAADFTLESLSGEPVKLATLRAQGPVILVVLRGWPGYQCPICTRQVAEFRSKAKEMEAARAQVVLVYPGPAEGLKAHAGEFAQGKGLPGNFHLVTDPDYAFIKSYDLRWDAPKETAYPSTFVINPEGRIDFAKVSRSHGDRARIDDVIGALRTPK